MNSRRTLFVEPGQRFGKLTVIREIPDTRARRVECQCECGNVITTPIRCLHQGERTSCGCKRRNPAPIGQRFGRLVVSYQLIGEAGPDGKRPRWMVCKCDCGGFKLTEVRNLLRGYTVSCGCRAAENPGAESMRTHGLANHPLYHVWYGMLQRCENPEDINYRNYGDQGVKVYEQWHDVATFITWIETNLGPRPDGTTGRKRRYPAYTIDRIDVTGNYEPGNVQWADSKTQASNKRTVAIEITCPCGQLFTAAARNAMYCSKACRELAANKRKWKQPIEFTCPCDNTFTSARPSARYCSKACGRRTENDQRQARRHRDTFRAPVQLSLFA